jgi:predicted lipoprotein with Yx(FWY)xxD motif
MKRLLWIVGLPIFSAACGAPGGLYGSAPAASPAPSAAAAAPSASIPAATVAPTATPAAAPASVVATQNPRLGAILTNTQGRTLYYFLPERGGKIVCSSSACTTYWPPSLSAGGANPTGSAGVTGNLSLIARGGGAQQITYNTWPLYTFTGDQAAGQTSGQGVVAFGGKWLVATPGLQP